MQDAVIIALNGDASGRYNAFYSTPSQYLASKLSKPISLFPYAGDFFPYNDDTAGMHILECVGHIPRPPDASASRTLHPPVD